jgi:hypothetical protein
VPAALLVGALVVLPLAAGCGGDTSTPGSLSPGAHATTRATADGESGPPKDAGGMCERPIADGKSLPSLARLTVERFIAAVDRGDPTTMRALLDPAEAGAVLAELRPVTRLGLLALEDRY